MKPETQSHTEASVITTVVMLLGFLCLWFIYIDVPALQEDEGIEISFGDGETGGGVPEHQQVAAAPEQTAAPASSSAPSDNSLMTQEDESAAQLRLQQEKERRAREEALAEERRRQREEQARLRAEQEARERAEAAERAKQQAAIDNAAKMGALFGNTDNPEGGNGTAESASSGTKGNPLGHGNSGGNEWSLNGRRLKGSLPRPSQNFSQEGIVVVNIIVDANGKVVSAKVGAGTTISDETTRQLAVRAAKKAEFDMVDRPNQQFGTITYKFKFN